MEIKFDEKKLKSTKENSDYNGIYFSVNYNFTEPSVLSGFTTEEIKEHLDRVGGFDTETLDTNTIELIDKF